MTINPKRIDEISLNAWPALQQVLYDGWVLRLSKGYTKRANSVNPLYPSNQNLSQKVSYCEKFYTERSLRPVFRLTPFSSPPDLDLFLESRGYQVLDQTLVMVLDLESIEIQPKSRYEFTGKKIDEWMEIFYQVNPTQPDNHEVHKEILKAILNQCHLVVLNDSGVYASCGIGVLEAGYVGLFDIVTDSKARRKGYGTQIVLEILAWARKRSARYSYLQVVKQNFPARQMYEKIGFKELYQYWYRVPQFANTT
jgi:GNAT superfamily N-acetyltransferase